jgi:ceramide glucosyltransferase
MDLLRPALILLIAVGIGQAAFGLYAVRRFARRPRLANRATPPVSILKPVCGAELLLEEAIASFCLQAYPEFQIVIGAQDAADPALEAVARVRRRFPACDIAVVVDATRHGANGKIGNLINMLPYAKHDVLVIADSDLHVKPDYLLRVVAELQRPGTGLVTTLSGGEAATASYAGRLGASHISHEFMPNALIGEALGRQDCLGGTMALRRDTLASAGGLEALADHLADDNVLGRRVRRLGLSVRLANTVPVVTVQERSLAPLWQHELRWARTIGKLAPISLAGCVVQYPLFWACLAVVLTGGASWSVGCLAIAWVARAAIARSIDRSLAHRRARPAQPAPFWLWPLRDMLSVLEILASFASDEVVWRGRTLRADSGALPPARERPLAA